MLVVRWYRLQWIQESIEQRAEHIGTCERVIQIGVPEHAYI